MGLELTQTEETFPTKETDPTGGVPELREERGWDGLTKREGDSKWNMKTPEET